MSRASSAAVAVAAAVLASAAAAAPLAAQLPGEPHASLWVGAGGTLPLAQPAARHDAGPAATLALDVGVLRRVAVRLEASAGTRALQTRPGGPLGGDQQQVRTLVLARVAPITVRGVAPYVLAGGGVFWQSDRFALRDVANPVPVAAYRQTTSHAARGALVGAGASAGVAAARLFAEARWTRVGGRGGAASDLGLVAGVALPLVR